MDVFPFEIWEQIVRHLAAYDLINFCKCSVDFEYLLKNKNIVINFDLGGCFEIYKENLYDYILLNIGYNHIKYLNINKLYWINVKDIRKMIKLLPNLDTLCAVDTKLGIRDDDVVMYKKLYDADEIESQALRYDYIVCNLRKLNKLVIKSKTILTLLDYKPFGLVKIYGRQRNNITTLCYVRSTLPEIIAMRRTSLSDVFESRTVKSWDIIQSFLTETPCSFKNSLDIYNTKSMKNIEFNELTFYHTRACNTTFVNSVMDILLSKHARGLQKLCLTLCILQESNVEKFVKKNVFRHIISNCPYLTHLEILSCPSSEPKNIENETVKAPCYSSTIIGAYELISNLKYLKTLTLEIPPYLNGTFLKNVFLTCTDLQCLQITSKETNEDLNSVLYSHINYAQRLIDFRFENNHIDLGRLFSAFNKVSDSKLRRIVVKCEYEHSMQSGPIEKLLQRNKDIIFLTLLISKYNRHQISKLQDLLNIYQDHPAKTYIAKSDINPKEDISIPEAHKDILYFSSNVSMLHFYNFK